MCIEVHTPINYIQFTVFQFLNSFIFVVMKKIYPIVVLVLLFAACTSSSTSSQSAEEVTTAEDSADGISFMNIQDGATVTSPFELTMGVEGMQVEPKGAPRKGFGHHHLLVNDDFTPAGVVIVADQTHIHYGGGQTSDSVSLEPGNYKLTLQFADGMHVSYGETWSNTINITVE